MDGLDLYDLVDRAITLEQALDLKVRRAGDPGLPFLRIRYNNMRMLPILQSYKALLSRAIPLNPPHFSPDAPAALLSSDGMDHPKVIART
jgi:hypothetical protein